MSRRAYHYDWDAWDRNFEECGKCQNTRSNVHHHITPEQRAIHGEAYYADFYQHEFEPTGRLVEGATTVTGYVPKHLRRCHTLEEHNRLPA